MTEKNMEKSEDLVVGASPICLITCLIMCTNWTARVPVTNKSLNFFYKYGKI